MADSISNAVGEFLVNCCPDGQLPGFHFGALNILEVSRNVVDIGLTLLVVPDLLPQGTGLFEVKLSDLAQISPGTADEGLMPSKAGFIADSAVNGSLLGDISERPDATLVVGSVALRDEGHEAIALEVGDGDDGCIDRELLVVHTETVTVGIWVREETGLEDWISRGFDVRDSVGRREGGLLDLCKVILGVFVQDELADWAKWELGVWPDLGEIQDVVAEFLSLLRGHGLHIDCPRWEISRLDCIEKSLDTVLSVLTGETSSGGIIESLESVISTEMKLSVHETAVILEPLVRVARVPVHVVVTVGGSTV